MPHKVLVADDEEKIARMVGSYLEASGYEAILAFDGKEALEKFRACSPSCLILDISMPLLDGLEAAREIRKSSTTPIIFLSARAEETDRILGLELGGDDYVTKPFSPRELVSRVRAVLRRTEAGPRAEGGARLAAGELSLDLEKRIAEVAGRRIGLTAVQFDILAFLMRAPGRVFTRLEILEGAIGLRYEGYERTLDAHVKNIRKAIGDDSESPKYLGTVRGVGYKLIEQGDEA
jgi:DNA-binding response OmpR family regulator